jgi:hypothetical protein
VILTKRLFLREKKKETFLSGNVRKERRERRRRRRKRI